jgi:hypothetical protein
MVCDTRPRRRNQTLTERKTEVKTAVQKLADALSQGRVKPVIGPQGAIAFQNWSEDDRAAISDACAYRLIMATGSATAKLAIARAEQLAGRSVDRQALAQGAHGHFGPGGVSWHGGH